MMKQKHFVALSILLTFSLLLSACSALNAATPDPAAQQATVEAAVAQTLQAASANLTSTAAALPTNTFTVAPTEQPAATSTPLPLPTATLQPTVYIPPTVVYTAVPPKPTATATPAVYSCKLVSTSPAAGTKIKVDSDFDATWKVQNNGSHVWDLGYTDYRYVSGTKMQTGASIYDVTTAIEKGAELTLIVDMHTPTTAGKYSASWVLTIDGATMCTMSVDIEAIN